MELGGFKIGSIRGIPIRIHFTFLLVLPLLAVAFSRVLRDAARLAEVPPDQLTGTPPLLWGLGLAVALFVSVLLHELAHSLYALKRGGKVRDITLMMVGGVSQISEMPREPKHEAMMAFVGPLLSIVLGMILYGLHAVIDATWFQLRFALFYLGGLNLFLGFFNLLPAFPMDGGRIVRALLTPRMGLVRATRTAAALGKAFAVLFGIWGLWTMNFLLIVIAVFVYMGADGEKRAVLVKSMIGGLRVRDLMTPHALAISADATVQEAAARILGDRHLAAFATSHDGRMLGLLTLDSLMKVPPDRRHLVHAGDVAVRAPAVSPADDAATALQAMNESSVPQLAVVAEDGMLVGSIDRDDILRGVRLSELKATQLPVEEPTAAGEHAHGEAELPSIPPSSVPRGLFGQQQPPPRGRRGGNGRPDASR